MNSQHHPVPKSKLKVLAWLVNKAIDNGNYDLPIADVRKAAEEERVVQLIRENLATHPVLDLSQLTTEEEAAINRWFNGLNGEHDIYIENQGLCLILAWTIEMMSDAVDPD